MVAIQLRAHAFLHYISFGQAIAQLLKKKSAKGEFSKNEIGEFLGGGKDLNIEVRKYYARTFDFKAMVPIPWPLNQLQCRFL